MSSKSSYDKTLVIITGPTAVGKTELSIKLAEHLKTDIISCDSRQIYKELSIGTAKPTIKDLSRVKHHFIDSHSIHTPYSAGDFAREARIKIKELFIEHDHIVISGGTGLFIRAILQGFDDFPEVSDEISWQINNELQENGLKKLQEELKKKDPQYFKNIDIENPRRVTRALAVIRQTGKPFSSFLNKEKETLPYNVHYFVLDRPREELYSRINIRVEMMFKEGLIKEARTVFPFKNLHALKTVGYQELFKYFEKERTLEWAIDKIKQHSRNYAKRQLTWFRKIEEAIWVKNNEFAFEEIIKEIKL